MWSSVPPEGWCGLVRRRSWIQSLASTRIAAGAVTAQTPCTPSSKPTALRATNTTMQVKKIVAVKIAPNGSVSAARGLTFGGFSVFGMRFLNWTNSVGYSATAAATVGSAVQAEKDRSDR